LKAHQAFFVPHPAFQNTVEKGQNQQFAAAVLRITPLDRFKVHGTVCTDFTKICRLQDGT
jgi:hypothetical protein